MNHLVKTVHMRGRNIRFYAELIKIISNYHQILPLIWSSVEVMLYLHYNMNKIQWQWVLMC